ncbi:MAG: hypothetical protein QOI66_409, partial [Myxococcales bacterium]|nr:hypothetical protein [Myxococcales bacterium]
MSSSIARRYSSSVGRPGLRLIVGFGLLALVSASCISTGRQITPDSSQTGGASSNTGSLGQSAGTGSSSAGGSTSAGGTATGSMSGGVSAGAPAGGATTTTTTDMPPEIAVILQSRCAACHTYGQADLGGWGSVMDLSRMVDAEIVTPGNPDTSRMIDRVSVRGDMPPRGDRVPTAEVDKLRAWITSLRRPVLTNRSDEDVLDAIAGDVLGQRALDADFRYFSLAHFVDMGRPDSEVAMAKNVLGFLVNSLSRRGTIVPMVAIDNQKSIFRVRLSDLGWSAALWDQLTSFYPYCLASDLAAHQSLYAQLGTEAPVVRADWLWDTASRAPLYDLLVNLPN